VDDLLKKERVLHKEVEFYESREQALTARAGQRKKLSEIARVLGSQLEAAAIQEKLVEAANELFSGRFIQITVGHDPDAVDQFVIDRKQPIMIPSFGFEGNALMAAPIMAEGGWRASFGWRRTGGKSLSAA